MSRAMYTGILQFVPSSRRGEELVDDGQDPCQKALKRKQTTQNSRAALLEHVVRDASEVATDMSGCPDIGETAPRIVRYSRYDFREDRGKNRGTCFQHFNHIPSSKISRRGDSSYDFSKVMSTGRYAESTFMSRKK